MAAAEDSLSSVQTLLPEDGTTTTSEIAPPKGHYVRWTICALLFFATTINYMDRSLLNVMAPTLSKTVGWTRTQYGDINAAFTLAYGLGLLLFGWFVDRVGVRIGYAVSLIFWSLASAGHALANSPLGFGIARFLLGIGEGGNFPSAVKTTAEWFPRRERALATGIFNAGSNVGAMMAPILAPILMIHFGWHSVFILTGLAGLLWVVFWFPLYHAPRQHPKLSAVELAWIESEPPIPRRRINWMDLLPHRQTWAVVSCMFFIAPAWGFYLFWSGIFMAERFGVDIKTIGLPLVVIYLLADVGSVGGGWLSMVFLKRGWTPNAARKVSMLLCALCVVPVVFAPITSHLWVAVFLIGLAAAAHQGFSANLYSVMSDLFPTWAVGSVVGLSTMVGTLYGFTMQSATGRLIDWTGSYLAIFIIAASGYFVAMLSLQLLSPRLKPVDSEIGKRIEA